MTARRLMPVAAGPMPLPAMPRALPDAADNGGDAVDRLARTLWGEAQGEPVRGIEAVAAVIVNRVRQADARGARAIRQESLRCPCWSANRPDRPRMLAVDGTDPVFATCLRVARRAVAGVLPDPTGGATRYHRADDRPDWAEGLFPIAEIGGSLFYGGEE